MTDCRGRLRIDKSVQKGYYYISLFRSFMFLISPKQKTRPLFRFEPRTVSIIRRLEPFASSAIFSYFHSSLLTEKY